MEDQSDPSTDFCEHCGQPVTVTEVPVPSELDADDPSAVELAPLFEIRTSGGRVVYVANLN
jgi:hypothetical protein